MNNIGKMLLLCLNHLSLSNNHFDLIPFSVCMSFNFCFSECRSYLTLLICFLLIWRLELGLADGQELAVADVTTPQTVLFKLNFTS